MSQPAETRPGLVATAGHVDHGKSTLVRAITGTDPDRWVEERQRGLTIDLGFAWTYLPSGRRISFIDVPGHVRFRSNMLAGVTSLDAVLLAISAAEGWRQQTIEHVAVLDSLGVRSCLIAITRSAEVSRERLREVRDETRDRSADTFAQDSPIVAVDAPAGKGVGDLRRALDDLVRRSKDAPDLGRSRLWIDRSFIIHGSGSVVTGTLDMGSLTTGRNLRLAGESGSGLVRVRGIESLNERQETVPPRSRVALNLARTEVRNLRRGRVLVQPDCWHETTRFDASLVSYPWISHNITRKGAYAMHIGSAAVPVTIAIIGSQRIKPQQEGMIRVRASAPLPLIPGDRFVISDAGRDELLGAGMVLDVAPILKLSKAMPSLDPNRVLAEHGRIRSEAFKRYTGVALPETYPGWIVDPGVLDVAVARLGRRLREAGIAGLARSEFSSDDQAVLAAVEGVRFVGDRVMIGQGAALPLELEAFLSRLVSEGLSPVAPGSRSDIPSGAGLLVARGLVQTSNGIWFASEAVDNARDEALGLLTGQPEGATVAQFRDRWGTTRRYALALLALLDADGSTVRVGDVRRMGRVGLARDSVIRPEPTS